MKNTAVLVALSIFCVVLVANAQNITSRVVRQVAMPPQAFAVADMPMPDDMPMGVADEMGPMQTGA